jgi:hypothetical protein
VPSIRCLAAVAFLLASQAWGQTDPPPTTLPPPRAVPGEAIPEPAPLIREPAPDLLPYVRVSAYVVWDLYAVDRRGGFKPRVISTPYGAYYPLTGKPYPWVSTHSRSVMPYALD